MELSDPDRRFELARDEAFDADRDERLDARDEREDARDEALDDARDACGVMVRFVTNILY